LCIKNNFFISLLGNLLFPRQAPWQQRKHVVNLFWTLAVGIGMGGLLVVFIYYQNHKH